MISSRFTYATTRVGFGSGIGSTSGSAWQKLKSNRASIGASLASAQSALASITSALASAQQDKISGLATLAAQAAIARIKADADDKKDVLLKQIDGAQKALDDAKNATSTKPKFVSWALTQTVDTTV